MLFRAFARPGTPLTFQFNLLPHREKGLAAARDRVLRSGYLGVNADAVERWRKQLATHSTMNGITTVLNAAAAEPSQNPPNQDDPTTDPSQPE